MKFVMIRWKIKSGPKHEAKFLKFWRKKAFVQDRTGLVGEFLSTVGNKTDFPYITWDIDDDVDDYKTFVNVGIWADAQKFHDQIGQYFNDGKPTKDFEFERRVRTVLEPACWRMGDSALPTHDSGGVL